MDSQLSYESSPAGHLMQGYQQTESDMFLTENAGYLDDSYSDGQEFSSDLDMIPVIGGLKMMAEYGFTGRDLVTGQFVGPLGWGRTFGIMASITPFAFEFAPEETAFSAELNFGAEGTVTSAEAAWWEGTAWRPVDFQGRRVYQRGDLFDPQARDANGFSNIERMQKGGAPMGFDGEPVNLHHTIQAEPGPIAEVSGSFHAENTAILHGLVEDGRSFRYSPDGVTTDAEKAFNRWKYRYWQERAKGFSNEY